MKFKEATDELFSRIAHEDLADALGISVASVRQSRLDSSANAHRAPPRGWRDAVIKLAELRLRRYRHLIDQLEKEADPARTKHEAHPE